VALSRDHPDPMLSMAREMGELPTGIEKEPPNSKVGFQCLHYTALESCGQFPVVIRKKTNEKIKIGVRTISSSAEEGSDFEGVN